jgi:FtsP/CotA-like multicopper oxidase with cupredoxin domain
MASSAPPAQPLRFLARPATASAFAVVLTYGATLFLTVRSHLQAAHHHEHVGLVGHWLNDATLVLPIVLPVVWCALALTRRLLIRRAPLVTAAGAATAAAIAGAIAFAAGRPAVLGITSENDLPLAWQVAGTALVALVVALPLAGLAAAAAIASSAGMRRSLRHALVLVTAAVLAGTAAWQAEAGIPDESRLRDVVSPCFDNSPVAPPFTAVMPIMPRATPQATDPAGATAYQITELRRDTQIIPGVTTPVWTYNGFSPGPTIVARKLRPVSVTWTNALPPNDDPTGIIYETPPSDEHPFVPSGTSTHLHGINTDHISDGYPTDDEHKHVRRPGESLTFHYPNNDYQRPATLWYHDHNLHITSPHVFRGLTGVYVLQDEREDQLRLPGSPLVEKPGQQGVADGPEDFDIPMVLKDPMIDPATGILFYDNCDHKGAYGDVMTMNGKQQPRFSVANRKYRFRLVNASDSRQYLLALRKVANVGRENDDFSANEKFTLIGTDQGLLPAPEPITRFHTAPSERHEFVIDFSRYPLGTRLVLVNLLADADERKLFPIMAFDVQRVEEDRSEVPAVLRGAEHPADTQPPSATRFFEFHRSGGEYWSINEQIFDRNRDDAKPRLNTTEDWILDNPHGGWGHPVHLHLGRFRIIKIEGRPPNPGELNGFKDTVWVGPNQRITVRHQFFNFTGRYVFHCHNGSHEDFDMMGQFNVQPGSPGAPGTSPGIP